MIYMFAVVLLQLACEPKVDVRREYHANGRLKYEYEWRNGNHHGYFKEYDDRGAVIYEGAFEDDLKTGWHSIFYPNGKVNQKFFYLAEDGKDRWTRKKKYDTTGRLMSDVRFAKKQLRLQSVHGAPYNVGDTLVLKVKLENPKYPVTMGVLGFFDEHLNALRVPKDGVHYIQGNADHEVVFHVLMGKKGDLTVTGFIGDYIYRSDTDSTTWIEGEDTFFSFPVVVE